MAESSTQLRTLLGIQQSFLLPTLAPATSPSASKGVVYTRRWVVDLLLDLAGYTSTSNLVDSVAVEPSAGDGAFLARMIERLVESCQRQKRPIIDCQRSLIAYELDHASAERARKLARDILVERGVNHPTAEALAGAWVRTGDYLFDSLTIKADFVIGNPPYVRLEHIPEKTALLYRNTYPTMRGRADLYVAFFEAALRQLNHTGTCAFICADRWMRNQYGANLRNLITSRFAVDVLIEMHTADAFHEEVDAYPAITVLRRKEQSRTIVASLGPEVEAISSQALVTAPRKEPNGGYAVSPAGLRTAHIDRWFKGNDPWPCHSPNQLALLRRLEDNFEPLQANAKVGIGVATGNDSIFITKDSSLVEPSRLLKLAMAKDICSGTMKWSGHYLVDPWNCDGLVRLAPFPCLSAYFEKHRVALKKRHTAIRSAHAWYKTIDRVNHALTKKPKLYIADIRNRLDPVLDQGNTYPHHNLYFIQSDEWDLEVLGGLLISSIGQFFVESYGIRMRGGYLRFQAQYLRRIRVPNPKTLSRAQTEDLIQAFRNRDRNLATRTAFTVYGIEQREMELAVGH